MNLRKDIINRYDIDLDPIPEYDKWPLPPQITRSQYNAEALKANKTYCWEPCPSCQELYPLQMFDEHLMECKSKINNLNKQITEKERFDSFIIVDKPLKVGTTISQEERVQLARAKKTQQISNEEKIHFDTPYFSNYDNILIKEINQQNLKEQDKEPILYRIACSRCGRKFFPERIRIHEEICKNLKTKTIPLKIKDNTIKIQKPIIKKPNLNKHLNENLLKEPLLIKPRPKISELDYQERKVKNRECSKLLNENEPSINLNKCMKIKKVPENTILVISNINNDKELAITIEVDSKFDIVVNKFGKLKINLVEDNTLESFIKKNIHFLIIFAFLFIIYCISIEK